MTMIRPEPGHPRPNLHWRSIARACPIALLWLVPAIASAQDLSAVAGRTEVTRVELEAALERFTEAAESDAFSDELRRQAGREAELVRTRLRQGDFQVGDQISLVVAGEEALTATFAVASGPALVLPDIGTISLAGILRAELEDHLRGEIARFIRDPQVQSQSSVRIMITGAVDRGGYFVTPTNAHFSDLFMIAGGPAANALLGEVRVERSGVVIWRGDALQQAIIEGRTLDQMSLRAGDHIVVPAENPTGGIQRLMTYVAPVAMIITLALQIR